MNVRRHGATTKSTRSRPYLYSEGRTRTTSTHVIAHVRVEAPQAFAGVARDVARQLGTYDSAIFRALRSVPPRAEEARARIEALTGSSGFVLFGTIDHGWLVSLFGATTKQLRE